MYISEMHVTPIAISDPPLLNAAGLHAPYALRTIVELVSDDHIYGLGEMPGGAEMVDLLEFDPRPRPGQRSLSAKRLIPGNLQTHGTDVPTRPGGWCSGKAGRARLQCGRNSLSGSDGQGHRPAGGRSFGW